MLTDFNDFWHTASRRNLTLVDCKFAHLTWDNVTQYLAKNKVVHKLKYISRRKWVALKRTGCVVWQNKWKQCYGECSKWPHWHTLPAVSAIGQWPHPRCIAAVQPTSQQAAAEKWLFWHSPGTTVAIVCGWGAQTYNLLMSSSFRIQCAKYD